MSPTSGEFSRSTLTWSLIAITKKTAKMKKKIDLGVLIENSLLTGGVKAVVSL